MTEPRREKSKADRKRWRLRRARTHRRPRISRVAVPSFFTLMNLLSGFFAIIQVAGGDFREAAWLIVAAGLFDALDGMMARIANAVSTFGVELDSLADVVSFGVAPAFLLYEFGLDRLGFFGVVIASLPALCGAVRLARFNVEFEGEKKAYFSGLPIPVQATFVVAFILVFNDAEWLEGFEWGRASILVPMVVVLSVLMISTVPFDALPTPTPRYLRANKQKALALLIAIVLVVTLQEFGLLLTLTAYLLYGIGRALRWAFRTAAGEEDADSALASSDT